MKRRPTQFLLTTLVLVCLLTTVGDAQPKKAPPPRATAEAKEFIDMVGGYLDVVEGFAELAEDPDASAIAAVINAKDMMGKGGEAGDAVEYFTKLLPEVKSPAVRRAIRIQLVELYKERDDTKNALEQSRLLITGQDENGE